MSSTSDDSGERSSSKDRPRSQQASVLRGLDLPHPTSPADTTHTEMIDIRAANEARTQAIPQAEPPADNSRTQAIRQAEPPAGRAQPPRNDANPPGHEDVPADSAQTEAFHQLSFGQHGPPGDQPLALSPEIAQYAQDGRTGPDARTNPIPQQKVSPRRRPRPGNETDLGPPPAQSPQPVGRGRPHGGPTSPIARQPLADQGARQPEQAWQLGAPEQSGSRPDAANAAARQADSSRRQEAPESRPAADDSAADATKHADRPLSARERKRWLFAGLGAAGVVILGIGATLLLTGRHSNESTSTVSALSSGASAAPLATPAETAAPTTVAGLPSLIPGYQVVQVPERGAAFDVPKQWQVDPNGTKTWGTAPNTVEIAGLVQDGKGYCPNYIRTNAFLTMSAKPDPAVAAVDIGARLAKIGWATSTGTTPGKAEPLTSLDGQLHGSFAETDGTFKPPAPGCAKSYAVYTFAFPNENGNFVITIAADTGVARSIDRATAQKILASIRPLQAK